MYAQTSLWPLKAKFFLRWLIRIFGFMWWAEKDLGCSPSLPMAWYIWVFPFEGSFWTSHTPEPYPRTIPRTIPPMLLILLLVSLLLLLLLLRIIATYCCHCSSSSSSLLIYLNIYIFMTKCRVDIPCMDGLGCGVPQNMGWALARYNPIPQLWSHCSLWQEMADFVEQLAKYINLSFPATWNSTTQVVLC